MNFHSPKIEEHMRFICPECGVDLPTQIIWRKHLNTSHDYNKKTVDVFNFKEINSRYHECNECHKWVANGNQSITTLQYHRISHLPYNLTFKCKHCVKAFARKRALCDHLINDHKDLIKDTNMNFSTGSSSNNNYQQQQHNDATKKQLDSFGAEHSSRTAATEDSYRNKKDPGDLIQKALLDSLIDLENETLSDVNMNQRDVNDFALNQSLNELEAILKGDFEESSLSTQFTATDNYHNQYAGTQYAEAGVLDADNEALEEICADIFEEVEEPVVEQPVDNQTKDLPSSSSSSRSVVKKERNSLPRCEEKIISIEIDTINESERRDMYSSPKRKRLKLDTPISTNGEIDERIKRMFETFIVYLCPECGREYKTQAEWRNHVFKIHDLNNTLYAKYQSLRSGSAFRCLECRQVLKTAKMQELMRHRFTHMPFQSYLKCTFCSKTKSSKPKIMQHMQMFHGGKLAAPSTTTTMTTTTSNKKLSHYVCSYCEKAFQARDRFQAHRQNCGARHKLGGRVKEANESSITSNLNLIAHLKKMRARMRTLISADDAKVTHQSISQHNKANYRKY